MFRHLADSATNQSGIAAPLTKKSVAILLTATLLSTSILVLAIKKLLKSYMSKTHPLN